MIALDTNILVYARREETPHHREAAALLRELAEGATAWALLWPCIYEFVRVVTHPRVFAPPSPLEAVLTNLDGLFASPSVHIFGEGSRHPDHFRRMLSDGDGRGNLAHDAHIAALIVEHGINELLTLDRDFARFPAVRARNPFRPGRGLD